MSFIDEVNAMDLGEKAKGRAPVAVALALVGVLVVGFAVATALQPPVAVVSADEASGSAAAEEGSAAEASTAVPGESGSGQGGAGESPAGEEAGSQGQSASGAFETIVVHVGGCVAVPGVYRVPAGSRADDAVKAAGGATADAAVDAVNLASPLEDGQQLIVPSKAQAAEGDLWKGAFSRGAAAGGGSRESGSSEGPLNLNSATAEELTSLSGIGDALAARIVADREKNGPFSSVDDLTRVTGIGEKKLEGFKDEVCV